MSSCDVSNYGVSSCGLLSCAMSSCGRVELCGVMTVYDCVAL